MLYLIVCTLAATALVTDAQTAEWRPPPQAKLYQPGEATVLQTPGDGVYNYTWYIVEDRRQLVFSVIACSSAQLAFATYMDGKEEFILEIELGMEDNTRSVMRLPGSPTSPPLFSTYTRDILHCNEYRTFWVKWYWDTFVLGKGPLVDEQPIMQWRDTTQKYFNAVGLTSSGGSSAVWRVNENSASHQIMHTFGDHRYSSMWKSVQSKHMWSFSVRSAGHAHVLLSNRLGQTSANVYEFVIGGGVTASDVMIRTEVMGTGSAIKTSINFANILSIDERREFWISWYKGQLELGRGSMYGKNRLLVWKDPNPFSVRYLSITTAGNSFASWAIQDDQENVNYLHTHPTDSTFPEVIFNNTWIITPRQEFFSTTIKSCSDASILISDNTTPNPEISMEVVIGAENNTKTLIRYLSRPDNVKEMPTPGILSCTEPRHFWVSWHNRTIRVGQGYVYSIAVILEATFGDPSEDGFKVGGLSLATPRSVGEWRVQGHIGERLLIRTPSIFNDFDRMWRTVTQQSAFVFRVRTCSDCHVAMSPTLGVDPSESYYDFVIGGWSNQFTQIHRITGIDRVPISEYISTPDLLNCNHHVDLWVSWGESEFRMGRGMLAGYHILFNLTMKQDIIPVKAVALSTGYGNDGDFIVDEDTGDYFMFYTSLHDHVRWLQLESYITWFPIKIRGCTQVMLYLCTQQTTSNCYTINIGSYNNTKTSLVARGQTVQEVDTLDVLHCMDTRNFWFRWLTNGKIQVGQGTIPGFLTLLDFQDTSPIAILNVGFQSTSEDYYARWQIDKNAVVAISFYSPETFSYEAMWETVERRRGVTFGVTACSDVHVLITNRIRWWDNVYDLFIGGNHNTRSVIRMSGGKDYVGVDTPGILSCTERRFFWITWQYGAIAVGRGEIIGLDRIMDYQPMELYHVTAVAYSTGYDYNGTWYIKASQALIPTEAPPTPALPGTRPPGIDDNANSGMSQDQIAGLVLGLIGGILLVAIIVVYVRTRNSVTDNSGGGQRFSSGASARSGGEASSSSGSASAQLGEDTDA